MPELISKYRIFLASPSDLNEERDAVADVISELNITYGNPNNIVIELLRWETNSGPAISTTDLQSIINDDIPTYDLFLGLLWMKFGTPTKDFGSGTEEEFNIAHRQFQKNNKSVQILFYFKNALPLSLEDIDTDQLSKVRNFKSSLGEKNVLYWEYSSRDELERFLRIHIPSRIDNLHSVSTLPEVINDANIEIEEFEVEEIVEEEFGILDYQEVIQDSFAISTHALTRISEAIGWIGKEMNKKTAEINRLVAKNKNQPISFKVQRNLYDRTADIMNDFANRIGPEIPIYINNFEKGIDAFAKLVTLYKSDLEGKEEEISDAKTALENLLTEISGGMSGMVTFNSTVEGLPRMSKEFNSAKANVVNKLNEMLTKIEVSYAIANEVHKNI